MAQHRFVAARQHSGEVPSAPVHDRVPDGVDAAIELVQPPIGQAPFDRPAIEPDRHELPATHDAVLTDGEIGEDHIEWGGWYTHIVY